MTNYKFGEIVLVSFPFTNQTAQKKRPAVVVSTAVYNQNRPDVILMAITSQVRSSPTVGEVILKDWQKAALLKPSAIKPVVFTMEKKLILKTLGQLQKSDEKALRNALKEIIGQ